MAPLEIGRYFNPLPPHGGRRYNRLATILTYEFQSTPSAWRETVAVSGKNQRIRISIHSLRMEGDFFLFKIFHASLSFQSTPSAWRETNLASTTLEVSDISIHSLRMEGDSGFFCGSEKYQNISIHSLRMEGDDWKSPEIAWISYFNPLPPHGGRLHPQEHLLVHNAISIHSLRMEGDLGNLCYNNPKAHFNPLPPHGGRLRAVLLGQSSQRNFNPLPPHGGRPLPAPLSGEPVIFQSTPSAWRETGDMIQQMQLWENFNPLPPHGGRLMPIVMFFFSPTFQSTPSAWRETSEDFIKELFGLYFNPLPPHGGRLERRCENGLVRHFNPLPPHGGRLAVRNCSRFFSVFQSTPSAWRET